MGLGQFGGGLGVTRWLVARGARVLLTDRDPEDRLRAPLAELAGELAAGSVELRLGGHDERDFAGADLVVANPAVPKPWENPPPRYGWRSTRSTGTARWASPAARARAARPP
jgi:UDP-N-acetylmuramoylalanine-D-glutamate ligase